MAASGTICGTATSSSQHQRSISELDDPVCSLNEKACRGRRCGRLFEKNRITAGRRSAVIPSDAPWEEEWGI
jgi:hypothetical protein